MKSSASVQGLRPSADVQISGVWDLPDGAKPEGISLGARESEGSASREYFGLRMVTGS